MTQESTSPKAEAGGTAAGGHTMALQLPARLPWEGAGMQRGSTASSTAEPLLLPQPAHRSEDTQGKAVFHKFIT